MAWLTVDKDGEEWIHIQKPQRSLDGSWWVVYDRSGAIELQQNDIFTLTRTKMTWDDEPFEI